MEFLVNPTHELNGSATVPGSKSNTIRAVTLATLASGESHIKNPLPSMDCLSAVDVCRGLGAQIEMRPDEWVVRGMAGQLQAAPDVLNVGNSGTTLYIVTAMSTLLATGSAVITGDYQIRRRPAGPLVDALNELGGRVQSTRGNGTAPLVAGGPLRGGTTRLPGVNSQWLTPLLIVGPLTEKGVEVTVDSLQERPYIAMTLGWLERLGATFENDSYTHFFVKGGYRYSAFSAHIPADWESATFLLVAAAITESDVTLYGLDIRDHQGDKAIIDILIRMGADVEVRNFGVDGIRVRGGRPLTGVEIDCRDLPDAPPILAVLGTQAKGRTVLTGLAASRLKETDRPRSIYEELSKMGARIEDQGDRLIIENSQLHGALIDGRHDHRIIMATAIAGLVAQGPTVIETAEYAAVSFPNFYEVMTSLGAKIRRLADA